MKFIYIFFVSAGVFGSSLLHAQVQVSKEPFHRQVMENPYFRLLDVWLKPADTTQFHIHSTPSFFLHFTNVRIATQVIGGEWVKEKTVAGNSWYRSFSPDKLVHRVTNLDTALFHVTDMELLSPYDVNQAFVPLPFIVIFENEKLVVYQVKGPQSEKTIGKRGPLLLQVLAGSGVGVIDIATKQRSAINAGSHFYMQPGSSFYLDGLQSDDANIILIEIK